MAIVSTILKIITATGVVLVALQKQHKDMGSPLNKMVKDAQGRKTRCSHCAEKIQSQAIVCKHCGRDVKVSEKPELPQE